MITTAVTWTVRNVIQAAAVPAAKAPPAPKAKGGLRVSLGDKNVAVAAPKVSLMAARKVQPHSLLHIMKKSRLIFF